MKFTKMQGIGNDYVYVDCFKEQVKEPGKVSRFISDRHFGIGADGLILICPSGKADCRMETVSYTHLDVYKRQVQGVFISQRQLSSMGKQ